MAPSRTVLFPFLHFVGALLLTLLCAPCTHAQMIAAHRGYWKSEGAALSQNSIASLREAQNLGVWGSEFDVRLTSDGEVIVNHDPTIGGVTVASNPLSRLKAMTLRNGEAPSTLEEYLLQGKKARTVLVLELKPLKTQALEDELIEKCEQALKEYDLLDPERVIFISFSYHICQALAAANPTFMVQYLNGDKTPEELYKDGIKGLDYHHSVIRSHPDYVQRAHDLSMAVNVWTVDKESDMKYLVGLGVDCITTNEPELARKVIGSSEILPPSLH